MTHDFAKPSTTKKPGAPKAKKATPAKAKRSPTKAVKKSVGASVSEPPTSNKRRFPFYISLTLLLCTFAYGLYFLQSIPPTQTIEKSTSTTKKQPAKAVEASPESSTPQAKRFNFYDILPESTVTAPKVEEYRFKEKSGGGSYYYMIQTGSFRNPQDAERQKATIAFQGLKATIEVVTNDQGSTWHRVKTGPFTNRSKLNSALDKLVSINIQPLVKKIKKDS